MGVPLNSSTPAVGGKRSSKGWKESSGVIEVAVGGGARRETGQGQVGSAGSGVYCNEKGNSGDAAGRMERDCSHCVARPEEGERCSEEAGNSQGVRVL